MLGRARRNGKQFLNPVPTSVGGWSTMVKVLWRYLTGREERIPKRPLGPFRTNAQVYDEPPMSGLRVTWIGHSSTLLEMPIHCGLFNLALHAWRQPIERVFAVNGLKLWSPEPGTPTEVVKGIELRSEWWRL
ncbi:MAG: hypothetical protein WCD57_24995 [Acidobacteriaceae bacterium]